MANPNPSPETRFGAEKGNPINRGGKTSEQKEAEYKSAEIAAKMRLRALTVMQERVEAGEIDPLELVKGDFLKLFKDSEDRAHGTPKQSTEITGDGENPLAMALKVTTEIVDRD